MQHGTPARRPKTPEERTSSRFVSLFKGIGNRLGLRTPSWRRYHSSPTVSQSHQSIDSPLHSVATQSSEHGQPGMITIQRAAPRAPPTAPPPPASARPGHGHETGSTQSRVGFSDTPSTGPPSTRKPAPARLSVDTGDSPARTNSAVLTPDDAGTPHTIERRKSILKTPSSGATTRSTRGASRRLSFADASGRDLQKVAYVHNLHYSESTLQEDEHHGGCTVS